MHYTHGKRIVYRRELGECVQPIHGGVIVGVGKDWVDFIYLNPGEGCESADGLVKDYRASQQRQRRVVSRRVDKMP